MPNLDPNTVREVLLAGTTQWLRVVPKTFEIIKAAVTDTEGNVLTDDDLTCQWREGKYGVYLCPLRHVAAFKCESRDARETTPKPKPDQHGPAV